MSDSTRFEQEVRGSAQACYDVALDFAAYPVWERNTKQAVVQEVDQQGRGTKVWFEFDTPVKVVTYTLGYDHAAAPAQMPFDLLDGDLREMRGRYTFTEHGDTTTVGFELAVHPGFPIPAAIKKVLQKRMTRAAVMNIKTRVEAAS